TDGGRTWRLLDSTTNADAAGNVLPINDPGRDHRFAGSTAFKVIVDPKPAPTGEVIVYAALGGANGGVWRSVDTGKHWTQVPAGGTIQGLYETKDFGLNWTKVRLPVKGTGQNQIPTNDDSITTDYSVVGSTQFAQGNYDSSLAVDPNNPAVVYVGGTADGNP